ncbi:MAG: biotin/lipoyl-binding protein [Clostridiales bacterium]|jgi:biotin carboxyl carrier protein|nr:biotin/lipoyl-binding protein [Clostridiales bacterium]
MKNYRVIVNGVEYEIGIEQMEAGEAMPVQSAPQAASAPISQRQPEVQPPKTGEEVKAPMPGAILSVAVKQGDLVKKGQVILILEAMKMENEILSPRDGMVASLAVQSGQSVETGSLLCTLA